MERFSCGIWPRSHHPSWPQADAQGEPTAHGLPGTEEVGRAFLPLGSPDPSRAPHPTEDLVMDDQGTGTPGPFRNASQESRWRYPNTTSPLNGFQNDSANRAPIPLSFFQRLLDCPEGCVHDLLGILPLAFGLELVRKGRKPDPGVQVRREGAPKILARRCGQRAQRKPVIPALKRQHARLSGGQKGGLERHLHGLGSGARQNALGLVFPGPGAE